MSFIDGGVTLRPWNDYFDNKVKSDLTSISQTNNALCIASKASEWIYLDDIRAAKVSWGTIGKQRRSSGFVL